MDLSFNSSTFNLGARYFLLLERMFGATMVHDTRVHQIFQALPTPRKDQIFYMKTVYYSYNKAIFLIL